LVPHGGGTLDALLLGHETPEEIFGKEGLFKRLQSALIERTLGGELTHHLGCPIDHISFPSQLRNVPVFHLECGSSGSNPTFRTPLLRCSAFKNHIFNNGLGNLDAGLIRSGLTTRAPKKWFSKDVKCTIGNLWALAVN
jgi:hypothetical protein